MPRHLRFGVSNPRHDEAKGLYDQHFCRKLKEMNMRRTGASTAPELRISTEQRKRANIAQS